MSDDMWDAPLDDQPAAGNLIADPDAERILAAAVMLRTDLVDDLAAQGFDPADITTDRYRWIWFAVEEIRGSVDPGAIRWEAIDRQMQAWRADGRMPTVPATQDELRQLCVEAAPGSASWAADRVTKKGIARRFVEHGHKTVALGRSEAFDPDADIAAAQLDLDGVVRQSAEDDMILSLIHI